MPAGMIVDLANANWSRPEMLVMSPGILHTHPAPHPVAALAKSRRQAASW